MPSFSHNWRSFYAHYTQHSNEFSADDGGGRHKKLLTRLVRLVKDVVAMVEVVELLRELECVFRQVRRLGRHDALLDDIRSLGGKQPQLPDLSSGFAFERTV